MCRGPIRILMLACAAAAGCASVDPYARAPIARQLEKIGPVGDCARAFRDLDVRIDAAAVRDAQAPRLHGFPYLRVDRFTAERGLALLSAGVQLPERAGAWYARLAALDADARRFEVSNAAAALAVPASALVRKADPANLARCRAVLLDDARAAGAQPQQVAQVPDDYSDAARALGLYPLTQFGFSAGINRWHTRLKRDFSLPLDGLPQRGPRRRYAPNAADMPLAAGLRHGVLSAVEPPALPGRTEDALGIAVLPPDRLLELLQQHAPVLAVETVSDDDRIGALRWSALMKDGVKDSAKDGVKDGDGPERVTANVARPVAYARLAHTVINHHVHLQLVYSFWFPARTAAGTSDLLAGSLDGLIWRVTLGADSDGRLQPLIYDTIHPCGCYHLFFPTEAMRAKPQPPALDEGAFVPQTLRAPLPVQRVVLWVEAGTHYLQRVLLEPSFAGSNATLYQLRDDNELRTLPLPGGRTRSAFDADGLIRGSERPERSLFWPAGIKSAGQMRQWGRHATAFVGRRHFDDPDVIARYFERVGPAAGTARPD